MVVAEEVITEIFSKITTGVELEVVDCEEALMDATNTLNGQFPVLIYKHFFIPRQYILDFWKVATNIDGENTSLQTADKYQIHHHSQLIQDRLSLILVSAVKHHKYLCIVRN